MKDGDLIQLENGRFAKILEIDFPFKGSIRIQYLEDIESAMVDKSLIKNATSCRNGNVSAVFDMIRTIHVRLNKLGKV